jgi:hypothetical protein
MNKPKVIKGTSIYSPESVKFDEDLWNQKNRKNALLEALGKSTSESRAERERSFISNKPKLHEPPAVYEAAITDKPEMEKKLVRGEAAKKPTTGIPSKDQSNAFFGTIKKDTETLKDVKFKEALVEAKSKLSDSGLSEKEKQNITNKIKQEYQDAKVRTAKASGLAKGKLPGSNLIGKAPNIGNVLKTVAGKGLSGFSALQSLREGNLADAASSIPLPGIAAAAMAVKSEKLGEGRDTPTGRMEAGVATNEDLLNIELNKKMGIDDVHVKELIKDESISKDLRKKALERLRNSGV